MFDIVLKASLALTAAPIHDHAAASQSASSRGLENTVFILKTAKATPPCIMLALVVTFRCNPSPKTPSEASTLHLSPFPDIRAQRHEELEERAGTIIASNQNRTAPINSLLQHEHSVTMPSSDAPHTFLIAPKISSPKLHRQQTVKSHHPKQQPHQVKHSPVSLFPSYPS